MKVDKYFHLYGKGKNIVFEEIQQWIPCSERLPNGGHNMLICRKDGTVGEGCYHSIIGEWSQFRWNVSGVKDVIAWMPLPEPYKENEA